MKDLTDLLDKYKQKYTIVGDKVVCDVLYLHNIGLTSLPESIGNLKCRELHLDNNNLTSLPVNICNLECERLYLYDNNLTYLSKLNENITYLCIDNFDDLTNLLYLPNLTKMYIDDEYYNNETLTELLNNIRHQKVMNDMNNILQII